MKNPDASGALAKLDVWQHLMVGRWFSNKKEKYVHIKFTRSIKNTMFLPVCHAWLIHVYSFVYFVLLYFFLTKLI